MKQYILLGITLLILCSIIVANINGTYNNISYYNLTTKYKNNNEIIEVTI